MGQTHTLFTDRTLNGLTTPVHPARRNDEAGIFQIEWDGNGTFDIELQGRSVESAEWYNIEAFDETTTMTGSPQTVATVVVIFPQMRARIANVSTSPAPSISAWLTE
jgi:hypothetical protein